MSAEGEGGTFVILNPASGGGRGEKRIPAYLEFLRRWLPGFEHQVTSKAGEEGDLADQALRSGCRTVVVVGGDGTWSTVADRIVRSRRPGTRLGLLPAGTGNDFGRNLGIPGSDPEAAVRILVEGREVEVDVGEVLTPSFHEERGEACGDGRCFLNVVGFGFDIAVIDAAKRARFLKGEVLYKVTALRQLFGFRGFTVELHPLADGDVALDGGAGSGEEADPSGEVSRAAVDDAPRLVGASGIPAVVPLQDFREVGGSDGPQRALMLTVSNGPHFGGGFPIAPRASLHDARLHACLVRDASPVQRLVLFDRVGKARHEGSDLVWARTAPGFRMRFPEAPVRFEIDGDVWVSREPEVLVGVRPSALRVLAP